MREKVEGIVEISFVSKNTLAKRPEMIADIKDILISNNTSFIPSLYDRIEFKGTLEEKVDYRVKERLQNYHYILATIEDKVVGFTEISFDDSYIHNIQHYCACVGTSAVHLDYQGYGIAKKLYSKLDSLAKEFDVEAVVRSTWTMNVKQIKLYAEFGYEEVERTENVRGEGNHLVKYCKWFNRAN